jgi:hypothetical protein
MTILFSTVLFVNGHPVQYEMCADGDLLRLWPTENPNPEISAPRLDIRRAGDGWRVSGSSDGDLVAQVLEDLDANKASFPAPGGS